MFSRSLYAVEYLRDGHVADKPDRLLHSAGGRDRDVGEVVDIPVSKEEGRESLWRRRWC